MSKIVNKHKYMLTVFLVLTLVIAGFNFYTNADAVQYSADLIPTMTSNTAPSGIASASSQYLISYGYPAWKAFDNVNNVAGWSPSSGVSGWLAYEFPSPKIISRYTVTPRTYRTSDNWDGTKGAPKDWTFEGWDGTQWKVLDTQINVSWTAFTDYTKKTFDIPNTTPYSKYRINVTNNNGGYLLCIGEMEMMETVQSSVTPPSTPLNLIGTPGDAKADLTWSSVYDATGYNVKRSLTAGGPYTTIATNVYGITFTDTPLTNGTTYYYIVTALNEGGESGNSNEVAVTPQAQVVGGAKALLVITMVEGTVKEYDMSAGEITAFINWYNGRAAGTGSPYYVINKSFNLGPFVARKDHLIFDKIVSFEVKEYN